MDNEKLMETVELSNEELEDAAGGSSIYEARVNCPNCGRKKLMEPRQIGTAHSWMCPYCNTLARDTVHWGFK